MDGIFLSVESKDINGLKDRLLVDVCNIENEYEKLFELLNHINEYMDCANIEHIKSTVYEHHLLVTENINKLKMHVNKLSEIANIYEKTEGENIDAANKIN